ncbi:MAG: nucleotidyltransferase domain-containing protein [archaeon]
MNLLDTLKNDKNMRRIFGERELKIIEKQLLGVRLRASEKTRLSRDIRKKFEAISSLAPFSKDFKLKHGLLIKEMINETKEVILETKYFSRIKKISLFGSAAENQLLINSDIDIAVEFSQIAKDEALQFRLDVSRKTSNKVDIQVYNFLPDKIKKEIENKGRLLYKNEGKGQNKKD